MEQNSEEWYQARLGKATASKMADITAKTKSGYGASRANYMAELLVERLTGQRQESYSNSTMQWGAETEPQAKSAYSFLTDNAIVDVGFIEHLTIAMSGASPDGFVGEDGLIEVKCPNTATHIENLLNDKIADKYMKQMQWQMACTGRNWCDFVSFDPRLPPNLQFKLIRVARSNEIIKELEDEVIKFLKELDEKLKLLQAIE